ncbi:MAG: putative transporter ATP-binding protein, partial [Chloroflexi bacterium]|nr:putative transporter ATP-binding protein [Chloroflexota bacterium]
LRLMPGEIFGLVGESGGGKSTTAMAVLRLIKAPGRIDSGKILLNGIDLLGKTGDELRRLRWRVMSLIPQGAMNSLNPVLRIREQIGDAITAHEGRQARSALRERIIDLLRTVGLPERVYTMYPHELSDGMKQRVCIAMAIALRPQLIIADEPTSALDVVVQRVVAETLKEVQGRLGSSVLLIGHDMGLQAQLVDRLSVMHRGRLLEVGSVRDVFKDPQHPYTKMLIGSVPSFGRGQIRAPGQHGTLGAQPAEVVQWDETAPLRELRPGHFAALA